MTWRLALALTALASSAAAVYRGDLTTLVLGATAAVFLLTAETLLRLRGQRLARTRYRRWEVTCRHCNYGDHSYHSAKRLRTALRTMWRHNRQLHMGNVR